MRTYKLVFSEDGGDGMPEEFSQTKTFNDDYTYAYMWSAQDHLAEMFLKLMDTRDMGVEEKFAVIAKLLTSLMSYSWRCEGLEETPILGEIVTVFSQWKWRTCESNHQISVFEDGDAAKEQAKDLLKLGAKINGLWYVLEQLFVIQREWKSKFEAQSKKSKEENSKKCCVDFGGDNCGSDG